MVWNLLRTYWVYWARAKGGDKSRNRWSKSFVIRIIGESCDKAFPTTVVDIRAILVKWRNSEDWQRRLSPLEIIKERHWRSHVIESPENLLAELRVALLVQDSVWLPRCDAPKTRLVTAGECNKCEFRRKHTFTRTEFMAKFSLHVRPSLLLRIVVALTIAKRDCEIYVIQVLYVCKTSRFAFIPLFFLLLDTYRAFFTGALTTLLGRDHAAGAASN